MESRVLVSVGWVVAASLLGFLISFLFAGKWKLPRHRFLVPYVLLIGAFLYGFFCWSEIDLGELLLENWYWGVVFGTILSIYLVITVRKQRASGQQNHLGVLLNLAWAGFIYGMVDALFLNVVPVLAAKMALSQLIVVSSIWGNIAVGSVSLLASLLVTFTYHFGYPEFRNKRVGLVLVGNGLITLAFLLGSNPLGSLISHTAMHIAAVIRGPETTIQLPPHYQLSVN